MQHPFSVGARPLVVGSVGNARALSTLSPESTADSCDLLEIRLDSLAAEGVPLDPELWQRFTALPILFTARREDEGGRLAWTDQERSDALRRVLADAACIDIEVASIAGMASLVAELRDRDIPWIASFHDFAGMPDESELRRALTRAKQSGASVFKWAGTLSDAADLARIAAFQRENHGIPVASMGMGPLATVSRLLAAQFGSVLNYGYLGDQPTAPGQWHAAQLSDAIARLPRW